MESSSVVFSWRRQRQVSGSSGIFYFSGYGISNYSSLSILVMVMARSRARSLQHLQQGLISWAMEKDIMLLMGGT